MGRSAQSGQEAQEMLDKGVSAASGPPSSSPLGLGVLNPGVAPASVLALGGKGPCRASGYLANSSWRQRTVGTMIVFHTG